MVFFYFSMGIFQLVFQNSFFKYILKYFQNNFIDSILREYCNVLFLFRQEKDEKKPT